MRLTRRSVAFYAWVVVALSVLALAGSLGVRAAFGAFVVPWEQTFSATRAEVSAISFVSLIVYGFAMPIAGRLTDRFGARVVLSVSMVVMGIGMALGYFAQSLWQLVILYGLIAAAGTGGTSTVTASVAVIQWFRERRGLALGITNSGIPVGQILVAPAAIFLVEALGWRYALLILGLIYLGILGPVMAALYRNSPPGSTTVTRHPHPPARQPDGLALSSPASYLAFFRRPVVWLLIIPYTICGFTDLGLVLTHFVPLAEGRGFSPGIIALALTINAATSIGGNIVTGLLADRMRLPVLLAIVYLSRGASLILLLFAHDPVLLLAFAVANGIVAAAAITPTAALCARIYGTHQVGAIFGLVSMFHHFGAAAGALVIGLLFTLRGSYDLALVFSMGILALGTALSLAIKDRR